MRLGVIMPRIAAESAYTLGAVWYIGAGITVRSPGASWKISPSNPCMASRWASVAGTRTTPFGRPVVPEV